MSSGTKLRNIGPKSAAWLRQTRKRWVSIAGYYLERLGLGRGTRRARS